VKSDFKPDMDMEQRAEEVLDSPKATMETEVVSKVEMPEEDTEPEKPAAAGEEAEQLAVNVPDTEVPKQQETEESIVTLSEEMNEMEIEGVLPGEKADVESVPVAVAPTDSDKSSEKISDPAAALDAEPEKMPPGQEENGSEQVGTETDLQTAMDTGADEVSTEVVAEKDVVAEPTVEEEKPAETVVLAAEAAKPTEVLEVEKPAETLPFSVAEKGVVAEPTVEEEKPAETVVLAAEAAKPTETVAEKDAVEVEKPVETVVLSVSVAEKGVAAEPTVEVEEEKPAETVVLAAEAAKPIETVTLKEEATTTESVELAKDEKEAELHKEEDAAPASGSLSFALLEREQTKDALRTSRTLVVLKGLPGSGKSFLARAIADAYKGHCSVFCADDHGVKPEDPESSVEGYRALDEAVVACCGAGAASSALMVVDDTNHTQDRLARLGEIAMRHGLVVVFLEPLTEWSRDPARLREKNTRGLEEAQLEAMKASLEEMSVPLYFGWFLLSSIQDKVRCTSMDFLKTLDTLKAFKKHLIDCEYLRFHLMPVFRQVHIFQSLV